jgi:hypothetical protein
VPALELMVSEIKEEIYGDDDDDLDADFKAEAISGETKVRLVGRPALSLKMLTGTASTASVVHLQEMLTAVLQQPWLLTYNGMLCAAACKALVTCCTGLFSRTEDGSGGYCAS